MFVLAAIIILHESIIYHVIAVHCNDKVRIVYNFTVEYDTIINDYCNQIPRAT